MLVHVAYVYLCVDKHTCIYVYIYIYLYLYIFLFLFSLLNMFHSYLKSGKSLTPEKIRQALATVQSDVDICSQSTPVGLPGSNVHFQLTGRDSVRKTPAK